MSNDSVIKKISIRSLMLLLLIFTISVPMLSAPILSNMMYSSSNLSKQSISQLAYAQNGDDSGGDSSGGDQSTSTPSDPSLASTPSDPSLASTPSDPSLASTPSDPSLEPGPLSLTDNIGNSSPSLVSDSENEDLNCDDISGKNFEVSSNDPNDFDRDNDGIGCESNGNNSNGNLTTSQLDDNDAPDGDCLFNPDLPKCASVDGVCPDGFFQNGYEQCVPEGGCPDGYHTVDDDETGRCIANSDGCPDGMIFRPDGETCGYKEDLCQDNADLDGCVETPQECNNGRDDDADGLTDSEDPDCQQQPSCDPSYPDHCIPPPPPNLNCPDDDGDKEDNEVPYENFKVNSPDPHDFDRDNDGIGCENGNDGDRNDGDNDIVRASQDTCDDISDTIDLFPGQLDSERVQIIAYFEDCEVDLASLTLNMVEDDDLKLVAANFEEGVSDAIEVELEPIDNQESNSGNSLYEASISGTQEGLDLETGDSKTISNVNGMVLWNNGDDPIQFAENNSVEFDIEFG